MIASIVTLFVWLRSLSEAELADEGGRGGDGVCLNSCSVYCEGGFQECEWWRGGGAVVARWWRGGGVVGWLITIM